MGRFNIMQRRTKLLLLAAVVVGYGGIAVLGAALIQQQSQLQSLKARLDSSPAATKTTSPSPVSATASPPAASPTAGSGTVFPAFVKVTDNFGHTWISNLSGPLTVKPGTVFTFTAVAQDPLNRPLQYVYFTGQLPSVQILCNWGGPSCTWTPATNPYYPYQVNVSVGVRDNEATHRLNTCGFADSCDDLEVLTFIVSAV